jgi:hypothetical protein
LQVASEHPQGTFGHYPVATKQPQVAGKRPEVATKHPPCASGHLYRCTQANDVRTFAFTLRRQAFVLSNYAFATGWLVLCVCLNKNITTSLLLFYFIV